MEIILQKIKSNKKSAKKGFTIAELLLVIAIMGVTLSAITMGVTSAMRLYKAAMRRSQTDILYSTLYEAISAELRSATDIRVDADGNLESFHSELLNTTGDITSELTDTNGNVVEGTDGMLFVGSQPIVSRNAYQDGVKAYIEPIKYDEAENVFDVNMELKIEIEGEEDFVKTHAFKVSPLNYP